MWLINTYDYSLREIQDPSEDFPYAILSHTWNEIEDSDLQREVRFLDMRDVETAKKKSGWAKVYHTCELAKAHSPALKWAWIDSCCIDKSSSAELTESINSMFRWYQQAEVCFVYLSDLDQSPTADLASRRSRADLEERIPNCRWFSRGWTLQELLAPERVVFYDKTWTKRGTKHSLKSVISKRTGIEVTILDQSEELANIPVGRRMSWASDRTTKRIEDIAYCLLGIFGVNMPLIYGEGEKAFIRLQAEIARQTSDLSLFAWSLDHESGTRAKSTQAYYGMFATSHRDFESCKNLYNLRDPSISERYSFTATNRGLDIQTVLQEDSDEKDYLMNLYCHRAEVGLSGGKPGLLAIRLVKTLGGFVRHRVDSIFIPNGVFPTHMWPGPLATIKLPAVVTAAESRRLEKRLQNAFRFRIQKPANISVNLVASLGLKKGPMMAWETMPAGPHAWDEVSQIFMTGSYPLFCGMLCPMISSRDEKMQWPQTIRILFGFDHIATNDGADISSSDLRLDPWASLIVGADECIEVPGNFTDESFAVVEFLIQQKEQYASAVSAFGHYIRKKVHEPGHDLPKKITLIPYHSQDGIEGLLDRGRSKQQMEKVGFSIEVRNEVENELTIHDVIIRLEPIDQSKSVPIRERRNRSGSLGRSRY